MLRVKICGLTSLREAHAAIEAGANFIGFNFFPPSPRYLSPEDCAPLVRSLRQQFAGDTLQLVGVFVNAPVDQVRAIMESCELDLAQLSGDETANDLAAIGLERAFKVVRSADNRSLVDAASLFPLRSQPPSYLVDASVPGKYGGTGRVADWAAARQLADRAPVLLAGGLHPGNVGAAVRQVRPWGVDVASGVETAPGIKDFEKMCAFVQAARESCKEVN